MHTSIDQFITASKKTLDFLHEEFKGLQIGQASAGIVEHVSIDSYGSSQPLKNVASIGLDGPQSILITPWDKGLLSTIEKAIRDDVNLGLSPINDGAGVRINIPPLTTERRKDLGKVVSKMGEEAKITIRKHRHDSLESIKKDSELSEDQTKQAEKDLQKNVDDMNKNIDTAVKTKQSDIMN